AIIMANHQSYLDPPLMMAVCKRPIRFLGKHSLFYYPVFGWALWATGHIPINRGVREKAFKSIDRAAEAIAKGKTVLIFPEGTRSRVQGIAPFKKGGFVLAIKSGVPIVPVGIAGTKEILPPGWSLLAPGAVQVVIGDPIEMTGYTLETKEALMEKVKGAIVKARDQAKVLSESYSADLNN
ncbi:MAG: lysophospholipid acyltransferase family protein, partial [Pseudomonadota bacterium]